MRASIFAAVGLALAAAGAAHAQTADCQRYLGVMSGLSAGRNVPSDDVLWAMDYESGLKRMGSKCEASAPQAAAASSPAAAVRQAGPVTPVMPVIDQGGPMTPGRPTLSPAILAVIDTLPPIGAFPQPHPRFLDGEAAYGQGDKSGAMAAWRDAMNAGDARGHYRVGAMLVLGDGVARDQVRGAALVRAAAERGLPPAMYEMYTYHRDRVGGLQPDEAVMLHYVKASAASRAAAGQYVLSRLYAEGLGGLPVEPGYALGLLMASAEGGWADAQYTLGLAYKNGSDGVTQAPSEALRWLRRAAELGHPDAQLQAGIMYWLGNGAPQDHAQAVRYFMPAAQNGDRDAQAFLGDAYRRGIGAPFDMQQARYWLGLAAQQGQQDAIRVLAYVAEVDRNFEARQAAPRNVQLQAPGQATHDAFMAHQKRVRQENCAAWLKGAMRQCGW